MNYLDYEKAFSEARLTKYKRACGGDNQKALILYRYNIKLCQKLYGVLNVFEVVLRNAIDVHYRFVFKDPDWIRSQLKTGGMLEFSPQKDKTLELVSTLVRQKKYTHDRLVSSVTFGFWTYMFNRIPYRIGGQSLLTIFLAKDHGLNQKTIFKELTQIKNFRNKIAHHEAICFDADGNKNIADVWMHYQLILKYLRFLGYTENQLLAGLDVLPYTTLKKFQEL